MSEGVYWMLRKCVLICELMSWQNKNLLKHLHAWLIPFISKVCIKLWQRRFKPVPFLNAFILHSASYISFFPFDTSFWLHVPINLEIRSLKWNIESLYKIRPFLTVLSNFEEYLNFSYFIRKLYLEKSGRFAQIAGLEFFPEALEFSVVSLFLWHVI